MAWGNNGNQVYVQDMISGVNDKKVLKVNDVNDDNDDKKAAHFINSSTDPDARALLVDGKAEIESLVIQKSGNLVKMNAGANNIYIGTDVDNTQNVNIGRAGKKLPLIAICLRVPICGLPRQS